MLRIARILLAILGVYYVTFIITKLAGPWKMFRKLREKAKTDLVSCPHCLGFWCSAVAATWLFVFEKRECGRKRKYARWELPLLWFGIAGGSSVIHSFDKSG